MVVRLVVALVIGVFVLGTLIWLLRRVKHLQGQALGIWKSSVLSLSSALVFDASLVSLSRQQLDPAQVMLAIAVALASGGALELWSSGGALVGHAMDYIATVRRGS